MRLIGFDLESFDPSFPPAGDPTCHQHRIVAIGVIVIDTSLPMVVEEFNVDVAAEVTGAEVPDEAMMLRTFADRVERLSPNYEVDGKLRYDFVTYNGSRWDFPLMMLRCFKHGIPMPWYTETKETSRPYSPEGHLDLCRYVAGNGSMSPMAVLAEMMGLPGKTGVDGSDVQKLVMQGKAKVLADYCASDTFQQILIGLRVQALRGLLSIQKYNSVVDSIMQYGLTCQYPTVQKIAATANARIDP